MMVCVCVCVCVCEHMWVQAKRYLSRGTTSLSCIAHNELSMVRLPSQAQTRREPETLELSA